VTTELVISAQRGDRDAFERIVQMALGRLYGTASLIVRDPEAARDAVQEMLISIWRDLPSLRDPQAFEGWTYRILLRSCYRAVRDRHRRSVEVPAIESDAFVEAHEDRLQGFDHIERAFRRLTPEHRAVLVLHHRLDLQLGEIAVALGVPVGTVKSRLNRASAAFRAAYDAEDREPALVRGHTA
jgi:RNA polymerase sigma factor (sigma-70 family)